MPSIDRIAAVGDIPLRLLADDPAGASALRLLLGSVPDSSERALGTVRAGGRGPELPGRDPDQEFDDRRVWLDDDEVTFLDRTGVAGRSGPTGAVIGGGGTDAASAELGIRRLFLSSVGHLLGFHDRFLVHAGAVIADGSTILLLGSSGAGKSTVALASFARGWPVLTDDLAVLRRTGDGVQVIGIPRPPTVPADLGAPVGADARLVANDPRKRLQLPAEVLTGGFHDIDGVVVVAHGTGPVAELTPENGRAIHLLLVGSFPPASHPDQLRRAHPVFAAVSRLPARRLAHGADPGRRTTSAARTIGGFSRELARLR